MNEIHAAGEKDVERFLGPCTALARTLRRVGAVNHPRLRTARKTSTPLPRVRIGFVALVDCAPLLVAESLGIFAKHGVEVELSREVGWATIREKVLYGQLDAAHAPAGLALSLRLGL